eukprot:CAMPEP_0183598290 /NCGR_PEP_ID=MMETSP0371-20130417/178422_1 /TAXON_ID=268820 /ORGANISM="Peridinium aciculiferum, Strain PAER-2" /LENGTH=100 /DNA_ID=CAMNT_0025810323 /DNA_START=24 /DNA_END=322 /DNA_ORIENTATION=+
MAQISALEADLARQQALQRDAQERHDDVQVSLQEAIQKHSALSSQCEELVESLQRSRQDLSDCKSAEQLEAERHAATRTELDQHVAAEESLRQRLDDGET